MTSLKIAMEQKILVVDDDKYTRTLLEGVFRDGPASAQFACDVAEARSLFAATDFNLIIMDQRLPDGNGLDLLRDMRAERPQQVAILITGYADVHDAVRAVREGLFDYLTKPFDNIEELEAVVEKALELDRAYREINSLRESLQSGDNVPIHIGHSAAMLALQNKINQVAPLDVTILIEGESGTGKELAARSIYAKSPRSKGRFSRSIAALYLNNCLKARFLATRKGPSPGPQK